MDPLTHIVIGRAVVAAARGEARNRSIGAAAILGALAPDADSALALAGWDRYVRAHQFGTHSLLGALAMAGVTAVVVDQSAKAFARRRGHERNAQPAAERFAVLFAAAGAGAMSHIALDLLSGARIAIGWPLLDRRVSLPLLAMADPWFVAMCVAWIFLLWPVRLHLRRASRALLAAAAIVLCAKAALLATAVHRSRMAPQGPRALEARWGSLTDWLVFERLAGSIRASAISATGSAPAVLISEPLAVESRVVSASRGLDDVQNFLAVHEFAFPDEIRDGGGRTAVFWSDVRYCWPATPGATWRPASNCGVHVGGVFDANGHAMTQEIRIGGFVQTRPP
jgi:membrane-bound metal-dependent hydrolase YbcI (DUF457 family)